MESDRGMEQKVKWEQKWKVSMKQKEGDLMK